MRPNRKRSGWLSPLVIRSLGVLAITLMAMTSAPASGISPPGCTVPHCPEYAPPLCLDHCIAGARCDMPRAVPTACLECYVTKCTRWNCPRNPGGPDNGEVVRCVLKPDTPW